LTFLQRKQQPTEASNNLSTPSNSRTLSFIQRVIRDTETPSWLNSVPHNFGEAEAGTIKADEWRVLSTVYLPIALIALWGDDDGKPPEGHGHLQQVLDHSMAFFQAITIAMRYSMTDELASKYRNLLKQWIDGLRTLFPHISQATSTRTNIHVALHLHDFLHLFGPVISWWCFPFERLINTHQKTTTNDHIGGGLYLRKIASKLTKRLGQMEATMVKSYMRSGNLRRWLRRPDCLAIIRQVAALFEKVFPPFDPLAETTSPAPKLPKDERAHYTVQNYLGKVTYSRASTHLGNSIILYYDAKHRNTVVAGQIQKIKGTADESPTFAVKHHVPLPSNVHDPFKRYPYFPAKCYSSKLNCEEEIIVFSDVVGHGARFELSHDRSVIVNLSRV
jgi:hypothetical protein